MKILSHLSIALLHLAVFSNAYANPTEKRSKCIVDSLANEDQFLDDSESPAQVTARAEPEVNIRVRNNDLDPEPEPPQNINRFWNNRPGPGYIRRTANYISNRLGLTDHVIQHQRPSPEPVVAQGPWRLQEQRLRVEVESQRQGPFRASAQDATHLETLESISLDQILPGDFISLIGLDGRHVYSGEFHGKTATTVTLRTANQRELTLDRNLLDLSNLRLGTSRRETHFFRLGQEIVLALGGNNTPPIHGKFRGYTRDGTLLLEQNGTVVNISPNQRIRYATSDLYQHILDNPGYFPRRTNSLKRYPRAQVQPPYPPERDFELLLLSPELLASLPVGTEVWGIDGRPTIVGVDITDPANEDTRGGFTFYGLRRDRLRILTADEIQVGRAARDQQREEQAQRQREAQAAYNEVRARFQTALSTMGRRISAQQIEHEINANGFVRMRPGDRYSDIVGSQVRFAIQNPTTHEWRFIEGRLESMSSNSNNFLVREATTGTTYEIPRYSEFGNFDASNFSYRRN